MGYLICFWVSNWWVKGVVAYGGLPFPSTRCHVLDVCNIWIIFTQHELIYGWDLVFAVVRPQGWFCPRTFFSKKKKDWAICYGPALYQIYIRNCPDSKIHGANMGPNSVLSAPDGPYVGPMNLVIRVRIASRGVPGFATVSPSFD